jgi:hypothetical protein
MCLPEKIARDLDKVKELRTGKGLSDAEKEENKVNVLQILEDLINDDKSIDLCKDNHRYVTECWLTYAQMVKD